MEPRAGGTRGAKCGTAAGELCTAAQPPQLCVLLARSQHLAESTLLAGEGEAPGRGVCGGSTALDGSNSGQDSRAALHLQFQPPRVFSNFTLCFSSKGRIRDCQRCLCQTKPCKSGAQQQRAAPTPQAPKPTERSPCCSPFTNPRTHQAILMISGQPTGRKSSIGTQRCGHFPAHPLNHVLPYRARPRPQPSH